MLSLRAVKPDRLCVLDANSVCRDVGGGAESRVVRHEAREESVCHVGLDVLDRYARVREVGLDQGMVLIFH